ncbi:uncharacterized protein LOC122693269 [Cervus elaphus]|uniref:uncharacterized protein LOC122693269 n=1 Tax=Cervus elaphus TaxID=9860 RepID=UPI001CC2A07A|nr:uncharacterized protein LOC122693269 [Cervus elaphus]
MWELEPESRIQLHRARSGSPVRCCCWGPRPLPPASPLFHRLLDPRPCCPGDAEDAGSIPGWGKSPGGGDGNPLLPGESHGQRSPAGYSPWGREESDTAGHTRHTYGGVTGGRKPAVGPCPQMKMFWRRRSMYVSRARRSRAPTLGTLSPPPTGPTPALLPRGIQLAGAGSSGVSWIPSLPLPSPPGLQGLSVCLFPFLMGVQNNNNSNNSGNEGHAETKPAGSVSLAQRGCGVLPALPVLSSKEGAAWWTGKAAGARAVGGGGRPRLESSPPLRASADVPGPGGRDGVMIIKQHLHRDFVYKALSQGREARWWPAESGLGGRGPWSGPPAAAGSGLCSGRTKRYSFKDFRFPRISSLSLLSGEELAPACHSGRRRGVSGPRRRGPDGRETGRRWGVA